jgi:hypothetical protein
MNCKFCNNIDTQIIKQYWKLNPKLIFLNGNENITEDDVRKYHKKIIFNIANEYLDGKCSKDDVLAFAEDEKYIVEYKCNSCFKCFEDFPNYYVYSDYYFMFSDIFKSDYKRIFFDLFGVDSEKMLRINNDDKINMLSLFFDKDDEQNKRLFRAKDIWYSLPRERGGGENDIIWLSIVLSLFSAFLYDVIKLGVVEAYKKIKKSFKKGIIKVNIPKTSIRRHLRNENIKYNEKMLQEIIEEKTMEIVDKYVEEINS